ncbi:MAG: CRISPR-associated endonuclease Cas6 [Thermoplasmatales archaeon]|nr:CRISPR-associated endonuclease Cas6 [Thermoplasmatales archaeon]
MSKNLKTLVLTLKTDKTIREDSNKLRGYIGNKFSQYPILHHHLTGEQSLYTYPKVQYKIIDGNAILVGINEGADVLKEISDKIEMLIFGKNLYKVNSIQMNQMNAELGECRENHYYRFLTPWIGLNPENYKKYKMMQELKERKLLLNNIIVGNILSMCKGFDFVVTKNIYVHSLLNEEKTVYKAIPMIGFTGEFKINFKIPDFLGIGKGVSQGFGTIKRNTQTK